MSEAKSATGDDALEMAGLRGKSMEIVEDANALLLIALHGAIETELTRREKRLDTCDDAKIKTGQELRAVRDFVRDRVDD